MTDLHALLYEQPWCTQCHFDHSEKKYGICPGELKPPIAERMPEIVPPGLDLGSECGVDCFIGRSMKILTGGKPSFYIHASCDPTRMAVALHRLADERDAAKETK